MPFMWYYFNDSGLGIGRNHCSRCKEKQRIYISGSPYLRHGIIYLLCGDNSREKCHKVQKIPKTVNRCGKGNQSDSSHRDSSKSHSPWNGGDSDSAQHEPDKKKIAEVRFAVENFGLGGNV